MTRIFFGDLGHEPPLEPPRGEPAPICPICGRDEGDIFYRDMYGGICGCNAPHCVEGFDPWEVMADAEL